MPFGWGSSPLICFLLFCSGVNHPVHGDPQFGTRYHTSSNQAGGRSPALSLVSGSGGGRGSRRGSRRSPLASPGTPLYTDNLGISEAGVKPAQDNSDR